MRDWYACLISFKSPLATPLDVS